MLSHLVIFSTAVFFVGAVGFFIVRANVFLWLLAIELMAFAVNLNFLWISIFYDDIIGQVCVLLFLVIIAAESAFAFILLVSIFELNRTTNLNLIYGMKM